MPVEVGRNMGAGLRRCAARYDSSLRHNGLAVRARRVRVARYRKYQEVLSRLVECARLVADESDGVRWVDRAALMNLAQALHRVYHQAGEAERMSRMAEAGAERIGRGVAPGAVVGVVVGSWEILAGRFPRGESEKLKQLVLQCSERLQGGNVKND